MLNWENTPIFSLGNGAGIQLQSWLTKIAVIYYSVPSYLLFNTILLVFLVSLFLFVCFFCRRGGGGGGGGCVLKVYMYTAERFQLHFAKGENFVVSTL